MSRRLFLRLIAIVIMLAGGVAPSLAAPGAGAALTSSSRMIVEEADRVLAQVKETHYRHTTAIDPASGLYNLDCSALICFLLSHAAPEALSSVPVDPLHAHARAINFYTTFSSASVSPTSQSWRRIVRLMDAEPGDILAWRKDPQPLQGNTGHILVILEKPQREKDGLVRVRVMDASRSGHFKDTRPKGSGGVGAGTMWFRVDSDGCPIAFYWSTKHRMSGAVPMAIGRVVAENGAELR